MLLPRYENDFPVSCLSRFSEKEIASGRRRAQRRCICTWTIALRKAAITRPLKLTYLPGQFWIMCMQSLPDTEEPVATALSSANFGIRVRYTDSAAVCRLERALLPIDDRAAEPLFVAQ